jgi:hypothetical protein
MGGPGSAFGTWENTTLAFDHAPEATMREVEFQVSPLSPLTDVDPTIESACTAEGLQLGMKGTLASFPGSTHWHFKRPRERGTLEITSFPRDRRIWAQIQDGRRAEWIDPCLAKIKSAVEKKLKESIGSVS